MNIFNAFLSKARVRTDLENELGSGKIPGILKKCNLSLNFEKNSLIP